METLWRDIRYGIRVLRKNLGFTLVAALTLALGIGASTAIFSAVYANLLRPLPFDNPDRLAVLFGGSPGQPRTPTSEPNFLDYKERNHSFEALATVNSGSATLTGVAEPERIAAARVTAEFFRVLGVQTVRGRTFAPDEDQLGKNNVVVMSHGLWQRHFGSDPGVVGQTISLDLKSYTVIGILPPNLRISFPGLRRSPDLWIPAVMRRDAAQRGNNYLRVIGRMKPGVSLAQAQAEFESITAQLVREYPQILAGASVQLISLHGLIVGNIRNVLLILLGAVGFVLLIACANVANLQLVRASARQKEMALRAALGASRARVLRQLLTENLLLSLLGGTIGILFASWGINLLTNFRPASVPRGAGALNAGLLGFSFLLSVVTGVLFGLAPALTASSMRLNESLKEGGKTSSSGAAGGRFRSVLMIAEVALSLILLAGAGLLIRSFVQLAGVNPGFDTSHVLETDLELPRFSYPDAPHQAAFFAQLPERIAALPGVQFAGAIDDLPLTSDRDSGVFVVDGRAPLPPNQVPFAQTRTVTPDYFRAMNIPLIAGRFLTDADTATSPQVILINQALERTFFRNENPVGQRIRFNPTVTNSPSISIAGVVGDVHDLGLDAATAPETYQSFQQAPQNFGVLVVRAAGDPASLAGAVRSELHSMDKNLPLFTPQTMEQVLADSISDRRANMVLLAFFAGIALALAAVGIYGVISFSVERRTQEIGVRMALGAQRGDVLALVLGQGIRVTLIGIAVGVAGSLALTRVLSKLLFGVAPTDPLTFAGVSLVLLVVAALACAIPARRATRVDPIVALRHE